MGWGRPHSAPPPSRPLRADCKPAITGTIQLRPNGSPNPWWPAFYLVNSAARITQVTLDGAVLTRDESNFWSFNPTVPFKRGVHTLVLTSDDVGRTLTVKIADISASDLGVQF